MREEWCGGCTVYRSKDGIVLVTAGSLIQAMIRSARPPAEQVSTSMTKTRLSRCAWVIAARRCTGVFSSPALEALGWAPQPRFAGVTDIPGKSELTAAIITAGMMVPE